MEKTTRQANRIGKKHVGIWVDEKIVFQALKRWAVSADVTVQSLVCRAIAELAYKQVAALKPTFSTIENAERIVLAAALNSLVEHLVKTEHIEIPLIVQRADAALSSEIDVSELAKARLISSEVK